MIEQKQTLNTKNEKQNETIYWLHFHNYRNDGYCQRVFRSTEQNSSRNKTNELDKQPYEFVSR